MPLTASEREDVERFRAQVDRLEGRMRRRLQRAVEQARQGVDRKALAEAIREQDVEAIIDILSLPATLEGDVEDELRKAMREGLAASEVAALIGGAAALDMMSGPVFDYLRTARDSVVQDINSGSRVAAQSAVDGYRKRGERAEDIAQVVPAYMGLSESRARAVDNYRKALSEGDSEALRRELRDRRFDSTTSRAFETAGGLAAEKIRRQVERYAERHTRSRLATIARTVVTRTVEKAKEEAVRKAVDKGRIDAGQVRRFWAHLNDGRVRNAHIEIPRMNPDGVAPGEYFDTPLGGLKYPGDPSGRAANVINCRCYVYTRVANGDE